MKRAIQIFELSILSLAAMLMLGSSGALAAAASTVSATCASNPNMVVAKPGEDIVNVVFANINPLLDSIGPMMYVNIVQTLLFQFTIIAISVLYVAIYGLMIILNLVSHRTGEILGRLAAIGIFYMLLSPVGLPVALGLPPYFTSGWLFFDQYIGRLFMGGMNELIYNFTLASYAMPFAIPVPPTGSITILDKQVLGAFYPIMDQIFQPAFLVSILGLLFLGPAGAILAIALAWGFINFVLMILGALITYVRSAVGLTFLFGLGPIFIAFMLFHKTRQITMGWLNEIVAMALTPVMQFAYLSMYSLLLNATISTMLLGIDWCWTTMMTMPGSTMQIGWWRPAVFDDVNKYWVLWSGDWKDPNGMDKPMPGGLNALSILFFLLVTYLGKEFGNTIAYTATELSQGLGPAHITGSDVSSWIKKQVGGKSNTGPGVFGQMTGGQKSPPGGKGSSSPVPKRKPVSAPPPPNRDVKPMET